MKKIFTVSTLLLLFAFAANAQWYKLQPYTNPFANDSSTVSPPSMAYPIRPLVSGNGVILYAGVAQPYFGNMQELVIEQSKNDLGSCSGLYTSGTLGYDVLVSKNTSTYCFINLGFDSTYLYYTSNNFSTVSTIATLKIPPSPITIPTCFSTNFIYSVWEQSFYSDSNTFIADSLIIYRASTSPHHLRQLSNSKYMDPLALRFTSDSMGFMICSYANNSAINVIAKTSDSGYTWKDSFLDSTNAITGWSFPSPSIGYITERNGNIYKTTNAGTTWVKLSSPTALSLNCVSFANDSLGYIGGNKGTLYKTIDGGITWSTEYSNTAYAIASLFTFGKVAYFKDATDNLYKNESPMSVQNIQADELNVNVYPNPSNNGKFAVEITNYELGITNSVEVYNMLGEKISSPSLIHTSHFVIDLSSQPNGIYMYRLVSEKGEQLATGKLVIQK